MKITTERLLRLQRMVSSNRVKFLLVWLADVLGVRHTIVRLDPVLACNLRCGLCYFSNPDWRRDHPARHFSMEDMERLAEDFFPTALQCYIGCGAEPTTFKNFPAIVALARKHKVPFIALVTNGQLITRTHLVSLVDAGLDEIILSTHGATAKTYERLMVNASFARFLDLLAMIEDVKREKGCSSPRVRFNYTVCPENISELELFFEVYGRFDIHMIQLRPALDLGGAVTNLRADGYLSGYGPTLAALKKQCAERGVTLLYNENDPTYESVNRQAPVYTEGVSRIINPEVVWQPDFDWRHERYSAYKRRSGFRRRMLGYALGTIAIDYKACSLNSSSML